MSVALEVCIESVEEAVRAGELGARRVELCSALSEGGLTPSYGLIQQSVNASSAEVHAMIRPRAGDFLYSDREFAVMLDDVKSALDAGADGLVVGLLMPDGSVDTDRMVRIMHLAEEKPVTFHRAFDMIAMPGIALEELCAIGVTRILTSGGAASAAAGVDNITAWHQQVGDRIQIMAGCGVNPGNVAEIISRSGITNLHFTARKTVESGMTYRNPTVAMGAEADQEYQRWVFNDEKFNGIKDALAELVR